MGTDSGYCGWSGSTNWVVRYDFTTGATGASGVAIELKNIFVRSGNGGQTWGFKVSANGTDAGCVNARNTPAQSNELPLQYNSDFGYNANLSATGLNLAANTTYYMFVYVTSSGTECYRGTWNLTSPRITVTEKPARPEKTTFTVSPASPEYGTKATITVKHNSSSYKYILYYFKDNEYKQFATGTTSGEVEWDTSVLELDETTVCSLKCSTYDTTTGSSTPTFIDDYIVPVTVTFSGVPNVILMEKTQVSGSNVVMSWQGEGEEGALYVQGYSMCRLKFRVEWPVGGSYASCYIYDGVDTIIAQPVTGSQNTYEATTKIFNTAGAKSISVVAVDNLGRSGAAYATITVTPYVAPYVVDADAIRFSDTPGEKDNTGTNLSAKINASGDWSVGGRNQLAIYARFKQVGGAYPYKTTERQTLTNGADYVQINLTDDGEGTAVPVETERSYTVQFMLCDDLHPPTGVEGTPITVERLVVTSAFVIHSKDGGGGIALGGYNQNDEAEIFYPTHLYDNLIVAGVSYGEDPPSGAGEEGQVYFKLMDSTGPGTGVSTDNYNDLINKPAIDNVPLDTETTSEELGLEKVDNKVSVISDESTNAEYPTALAVYNAIQSMDMASVHVAYTTDDFDELLNIVVSGNKAVFIRDIQRRVYALTKYESAGTTKTLKFSVADDQYIYLIYRSTGDEYWSNSRIQIADPTNAKAEVFAVNTPVYSNIQQAYSEGKIILVKYDNNMYTFGWRNTTGSTVEFGFVRYRKDGTIDTITVNNSNIWGNNIVRPANTFEALSNKVTSVTALSTNDEYPTAKAVYDAIRGYTPGGGGGGGDNIFIAVPDITTYAAVTEALEDGKLTFVVASGAIYPYVGMDDGKYRFAQIFRTDCYAYTLSDLNEWETDEWYMGQGGDPTASHIFFATYGTTTYDEIAEAISDGKEIFAHKDGTGTTVIYGFAGLVDLKYRFYSIGEERVGMITVGADDEWHTEAKFLVKQSSIAPEFNAEEAYAVGAYAMRNGQLYKCAVAKAAGRPWADASWSATSVMEEIGNMEAALAALR